MTEQEKSVGFRRITIIGTGLMGCSLAALIRERGVAGEVIGVDCSATSLEMARRLGCVNGIMDDPARGVIGADAVVLALPLDQIFVTLKKIGPDLKPGVMLTCTAGTPFRLWEQASEAIPEARALVPAFPLLFSPAHGPAASGGAVLDQETCLISRHPRFPQECFEKVRTFWEQVGLKTLALSSAEFESMVSGLHLWPALLGKLIREVGAAHDLIDKGGLLNQWLDLVAQRDEMERCFQLYAQPLERLLGELGTKISSLQRQLGGGSGDRAEGDAG